MAYFNSCGGHPHQQPIFISDTPKPVHGLHQHPIMISDADTLSGFAPPPAYCPDGSVQIGMHQPIYCPQSPIFSGRCDQAVRSRSSPSRQHGSPHVATQYWSATPVTQFLQQPGSATAAPRSKRSLCSTGRSFSQLQQRGRPNLAGRETRSWVESRLIEVSAEDTLPCIVESRIVEVPYPVNCILEIPLIEEIYVDEVAGENNTKNMPVIVERTVVVSEEEAVSPRARSRIEGRAEFEQVPVFTATNEERAPSSPLDVEAIRSEQAPATGKRMRILGVERMPGEPVRAACGQMLGLRTAELGALPVRLSPVRNAPSIAFQSAQGAEMQVLNIAPAPPQYVFGVPPADIFADVPVAELPKGFAPGGVQFQKKQLPDRVSTTLVPVETVVEVPVEKLVEKVRYEEVQGITVTQTKEIPTINIIEKPVERIKEVTREVPVPVYNDTEVPVIKLKDAYVCKRVEKVVEKVCTCA